MLFLHCILKSTIFFIVSLKIVSTYPYAYNADTPIKTIIVPYQRNVISGHPYEYPKMMMGKLRHVLVPLKMDLLPNININQDKEEATTPPRSLTMTMGSQNIGQSVNFVDGAYPVYYMPGNANGKFNGKISLLS